MWRPRVFADYYVAFLALAWLAAVADIREGRPVVLVAAILITILMCLAKTATVVTITPERVRRTHFSCVAGDSHRPTSASSSRTGSS